MPKSGAIKTVVQRQLRFKSADETSNFATRLAPLLGAGDVILLYGDLGAGKTHFARSLIQARMAMSGAIEDVPSPTFTLVQTYDLGDVEIWHADLYRLSGLDDVFELGLDEAFNEAICLVEWPDRLESEVPVGALSLRLEMSDSFDERVATFRSDNANWSNLLDQVQN